jgi:glycosyltransferase involved in cell wall biosynthesis
VASAVLSPTPSSRAAIRVGRARDRRIIKVLLQTRSGVSVEKSPGGDVVQAHATARALRSIGIDARVSAALKPDLSDVDLVHVFNLVRPQDAMVQARHAWRHRRPVVLSTVYCDMWDFDRCARRGFGGILARRAGRDLIELAKAAGRALRSSELHAGLAPLVWPGYQALQRKLLARCEVLLPNSQSEMRRIERDLHVSLPPKAYLTVPNGIDPAYYSAEHLLGQSPPKHLSGYEGCVLCVGRVEGRKNQLSLIRALRDTGYQLVLAGPPAANQHAYTEAVRTEVANCSNVHWLGLVSEEEKRWLYHLARVHVLPSWMETTGLVSLEAAACGCALVVTPNGDTGEYFDGHAHFCRPDDLSSMRKAVDAAYRAGPDARLHQRILADYTWDAAARATAHGYRLALGGAAGRP